MKHLDLQTNPLKGSFTVGNQNRRVHPWVFTKYSQLSAPPIAGAAWNLYKENNDVTYPTVYTYSTSNTFPSPANEVRANNNDFQTTTQINIKPPATADGYPGEWFLWSTLYVAYENKVKVVQS